MTSTHAVAAIKRLFTRQARRPCRHARSARLRLPADRARRGDQDRPVRDGRPQAYRFTVRWGEERDTDDAEGRVVAASDAAARPRRDRGACCRASPAPSRRCRRAISAIKIEGERAYDLARDGEEVELAARPVDIHRLELVETARRRPPPCSRPNAARAPMCGRWPAISAARSAASAMSGAAARRGRPVRRKRHDFAGTAGRLCAIEPPPARQASPTHSCPLRPRWTTSRRWPSAGQMRQGSNGAKPFCCAAGTPPSSAARSTSRLRASLMALAEVDRGEIVPKRVFNLAGLKGSRRPTERSVDDVDYCRAARPKSSRRMPRRPATPGRRRCRSRSSPSGSPT